MTKHIWQDIGSKFTSLVILGFGVLTASSALADSNSASNIVGAGASFPAPVYTKWATNYLKEAHHDLVNYQSIGSGSGVTQIKQGLVDFGASDYPLTDKELEQFNLIQIPTLVGGVVVVTNIKGLTKPLVLDGKTLADIYLGNITKWNDPRIAALNPDQELPDIFIAVLFRSDGSGTTYTFTKYLDAVSPEFHQKIGYSKAVNFPVGLGGKGNEGVAAVLPRVNGSIGYVEDGYAKILKLPTVSIKKDSGEIVSPSIESYTKALQSADWASSFSPNLTNLSAQGTWPINALTYIIVRKDSGNLAGVKKFFEYGMLNPTQQQATRELHYVPLDTDIAKKLVDTLPSQSTLTVNSKK